MYNIVVQIVNVRRAYVKICQETNQCDVKVAGPNFRRILRNAAFKLLLFHGMLLY